MVADDFAVAREAGQGVQEGVAVVGLGFLFEFFGREAQGVVDVGVDEGVERFDSGEEGAAGDEPVEGSLDARLARGLVTSASHVCSPRTCDDVLHSLDFGEGFSKLDLRVVQAVYAPAQKEIRDGVQGVSTECVSRWHWGLSDTWTCGVTST